MKKILLTIILLASTVQSKAFEKTLKVIEPVGLSTIIVLISPAISIAKSIENSEEFNTDTLRSDAAFALAHAENFEIDLQLSAELRGFVDQIKVSNSVLDFSDRDILEALLIL